MKVEYLQMTDTEFKNRMQALEDEFNDLDKEVENWSDKMDNAETRDDLDYAIYRLDLARERRSAVEVEWGEMQEAERRVICNRNTLESTM